MNRPTPRRRHPARGARQNTAVFSAAAFIGLGAGLAVQNSVGTANSVTTIPDTATTVPITTAPAVPVTAPSAQEFDEDVPTTPAPTVATPPPTAAPQPTPAPQRPQAKTGGS